MFCLLGEKLSWRKAFPFYGKKEKVVRKNLWESEGLQPWSPVSSVRLVNSKDRIFSEITVAL